MKISVISFTKTGQKMAERILKSMCGGDETIILYSKCSRKKTVQTAENSGDVTTQTFGVIPNKDSNVPTDNTGNTIAVQESVSAWAGEQMAAHHALVFVGACGIAVRAIAPWITDKLHDSPVLVMDEQGQYVIPLLSGHVGGANELAVRLAGELGAVPVITTATDLHGSFAVDLFAKRNDLWIHNREGIARVSSKILAGEKITMSVQTGHLAVDETIPSEIRLCAYPPVEKVDVLIADNTEEIFRKEAAELLLKPKKYILGAGCKKGTDSVKSEAFLRKILEEQDIAIEQVAALASIDVKKEERCLAGIQRKVQNPVSDLSGTEITDGVRNISWLRFCKVSGGCGQCVERAAMKAAGADGRICRAKQAQDGMTVAIAEKAWKVSM
ncbi:MAG: cobalt-precorrin 5A hydrolase [Waltera sp.]